MGKRKRACVACGEQLEAEASARRQFCRRAECRRARARGRKRSSRRGGDVVELPIRQQQAGDAADISAGTVEESTRAVLEEAQRLTTPAGQNALVLARQLDKASSGLETGSSVAALSKQHLAALAEATKDAHRESDAVDELQRRRSQRGA